MDVEYRMKLLMLEPVEEIITKEELKNLLETNNKIYAYDGFEPSGIAHLGSAVLRAIKIEDFLKANVKFKIFIADWFAFMNNKMDGDMDKIRKAGMYLIEAWKACGVNTNKIDIVWASQHIESKDYWENVMRIMKIVSVKRLIRCSPVMGRSEVEMKSGAMLLYPAMQAADPFQLNVDICQLGMDQRHATMLSREVAIKLGYKKPVCIHHHLLAGLKATERMGKIEAKMSKSKKESAIFIHDTREEIFKKIKYAYCKEGVVKNNPVLEILRYIIFRKYKNFVVKRPKRFGGDVCYNSYREVEKDFISKKLHPLDLKNAVANKLDEILKPIREHFEKNRRARLLYEEVKKTCI